ncbi:hypothetical protein DRB89_41960 [Streptomyces sp. ICC4]|nr:hypothetical protein DRB89_41960 [Streptomyces sp. ICC4]
MAGWWPGRRPRPAASVRRISFSVSSRSIGRSRRAEQTPFRYSTTSPAVPVTWKCVWAAAVAPL